MIKPNTMGMLQVKQLFILENTDINKNLEKLASMRENLSSGLKIMHSSNLPTKLQNEISYVANLALILPDRGQITNAFVHFYSHAHANLYLCFTHYIRKTRFLIQIHVS